MIAAVAKLGPAWRAWRSAASARPRIARLATVICFSLLGLAGCRSMPPMSSVVTPPDIRLVSIDYSAASRSLTVLASDGVVYQHLRVPHRVYDRLLQIANPAEQAEYYLRHIRGSYPLVKIQDKRGNWSP